MSRKAAPSPADGRSWKTETDQIRIIPVSMMYVEPKSAPLRYVERRAPGAAANTPIAAAMPRSEARNAVTSPNRLTRSPASPPARPETPMTVQKRVEAAMERSPGRIIRSLENVQ
jgi:hypothetical protein